MGLPSITIGKTDRACLIAVAERALSQTDPVSAASMLLREIARARTVSMDSVPADVVTMHRTVEIRNNITNATRRVRLVYPGEDESDSEAISVVTPIGAALIGLAEGDSIEWCTPAGDRHNMTVQRVYHSTSNMVP